MRGLSEVVLAVVLLAVVVDRGVDGSNGTAAEDEEEVETFEEVEKNFKRAVGGMVKRILPYLMENGAQTEISGPCRSSIMKIIGGVRNLREWAMRFVDATGKIPPGILEGTSVSIGDYDECLAIEVGKRDVPPQTPEEVIFRGQYCLLEAHRPEAINRAIKEYNDGNKDAPIAKTKTFLNMFIRYKHLSNNTFKLGVCVPSKCSVQDVESVLNSEGLRSAGKITVSFCKQNEEEEITVELVFLSSLFGFILGIMIVGTLIDTALRLRKRDENLKEKKTPCVRYLEQVSANTSLYTNAIETLSTQTQETLRSLCGIRTIVVALTIYSHTYGHIHALHFQKFSKAANFLKFFESFTFSGIANGSVGVDTIFLIAGVTITYTRWREVTEKRKLNLDIVNLLFQRYFRMSAAQLLVICAFLLFPLSGNGPFWKPYVEQELEHCRNKWWLNILYINNFFRTSKTCLYHTWVLAVIMQLTLLSTIILWILKKSLKVAVLTVALLALSGIIGVGIVTVLNRLPGSMAFYMLDIRTGPITWRHVYILPYDHFGPFCIGLLAGYMLAVKKDCLNISRCTTVVLWCLSTACSTAVMFGLYGYRHGEEMDQSLSTFYAVMHRNVWGLSIAWLIVACATKHGGAVARVLHSDIFVPLDRLCYLAFLVHIPIMYYHSGILRERWYMGHFELMFLGIGYITLSFLASFFLHIAFVKPYLALESFIAPPFQSVRKMSFDPSVSFSSQKGQNQDISAISERACDAPVASNGCINVAYSKNLDGL